jgi:hypothetical protein
LLGGQLWLWICTCKRHLVVKIDLIEILGWPWITLHTRLLLGKTRVISYQICVRNADTLSLRLIFHALSCHNSQNVIGSVFFDQTTGSHWWAYVLWLLLCTLLLIRDKGSRATGGGAFSLAMTLLRSLVFEEICKASNILKGLLIHGLAAPVGGILEWVIVLLCLLLMLNGLLVSAWLEPLLSWLSVYLSWSHQLIDSRASNNPSSHCWLRSLCPAGWTHWCAHNNIIVDMLLELPQPCLGSFLLQQGLQVVILEHIVLGGIIVCISSHHGIVWWMKKISIGRMLLTHIKQCRGCLLHTRTRTSIVWAQQYMRGRLI